MKTHLILCIAVTALLLNACTTSTIAYKAQSWEGSHYRRGATAQCAAWVGTVVKSAGHPIPSNPAKSTNWLSWGKPVPVGLIRPGDVVIYARGSNGYHHAAIYRGDGKVTHRSTRSSPVRTMNLHYRRILGVRRAPGMI